MELFCAQIFISFARELEIKPPVILYKDYKDVPLPEPDEVGYYLYIIHIYIYIYICPVNIHIYVYICSRVVKMVQVTVLLIDARRMVEEAEPGCIICRYKCIHIYIYAL